MKLNAVTVLRNGLKYLEQWKKVRDIHVWSLCFERNNKNAYVLMLISASFT